MYIKKVVIENIRSISHFEMKFPKPAGWHVLIGDNGSGKTSVLQAMALGLIGPADVPALRFNFSDLVKSHNEASEILKPTFNILEVIRKQMPVRNQMPQFSDSALIDLDIKRSDIHDEIKESKTQKPSLTIRLKVSKSGKKGSITAKGKESDIWLAERGWFSIGFGSFRQFTGGNSDRNRDKLYDSNPKVAAHLSLYGENMVLTEALAWLKELDNRRLREKEIQEIQGVQEPETGYVYESENILSAIEKFVNNTKLLPNNAQFVFIDLDGEPVFREPNGMKIKVSQMSNGYQSVLGLAFELIRHLVRVYGAKSVFADIEKGNMQIPLPGVVLIDEIDAHLHPTWQTRIGHWFTQYFPNLQFIVTTHSPLICRACEKGSIWRLAAPGSEMLSGEIKGIDRNRLIYGNVLDAYGTEVFGEDVSQSENAEEMLKELADLNVKSFKGKITNAEKKRMQNLKQILPTAE